MKKKKRILGFLLSLVMVLGLIPGMSLTAYAATETYTKLMNDKTVVKFNNYNWYIIADNSTAVDAGTVTLLAADTSFGTSAFDSMSPYSNAYSNSTVKGVLDALTEGNGPFASVKDAIADTNLSDVGVIGAKLYLLSTSEAEPYKNFNFSGATNGGWWLRSQGSDVGYAAVVYGVHGGYMAADGVDVKTNFGVRPALKLNLSSVIFSSESKEFSLKPAYSVTLSGGANATTSGGATSQTGLTGAMTTVIYTANTGYYFAEFPDITNNGITAKRTSSTVVTVSGTPTADATITVPDAVEKTAATVTKAPTAKTLTYTGSAQDLVTAGEATGGTMQYALGTDATTAPDASAYTTSIPTATDAGTYYVWYRVVADNSHKDVAPVCMTVTIDKKAEVIDKDQKTTTLSKPEAGKKSITLKWKRQTQKGIKGYEIQYALDKNFTKDAKTVSVNKAKTTSKTIKKLKSGKKYYVRIRTFTKKNGEKVYSKWSKTKSVKVK